jgi:hypothetical protein
LNGMPYIIERLRHKLSFIDLLITKLTLKTKDPVPFSFVP